MPKKTNLDLLNMRGTTALEAWSFLPEGTFGERAQYLFEHAEQFGLSDKEVIDCINRRCEAEICTAMKAMADGMLDTLRKVSSQKVLKRLAKYAVFDDDVLQKSAES